MRPLLLDLDGTLLTAHGAGRTCVNVAVTSVLGRAASADGVSFSGKTDLQILREVLRHNGAEGLNGELDALVTDAGRRYQEAMLAALTPGAATALPGARAAVDALRDAGFEMGLLTGNVEPCAYAKLDAAGLGGLFDWGAFGSDAEERNALPAHAATRYAARYGRPVEASAFVVIGDTPLDVGCARAAGAAVVAVATGHYDRDALAAHEPDLLLDSLEDVDPLLRFLGA